MKQSAPYKNGQALSYAEYGDKNGYPLLIQHGLIASISDDDLFDRFAALTPGGDDPAAALESDAAVAALLEHVPVADREVLRLALIHELDGESLARALGVRPGAARVRLHRALGRLREAVIRDGSVL